MSGTDPSDGDSWSSASATPFPAESTTWLGERLARRAALTVAGDDDETDGGASARRCVHRQWRDGTLAMTTTDLRAETLHAGFRAERPDRTRFADGVRACIERLRAAVIERDPRDGNVGERAASRVGNANRDCVADDVPCLATRVFGERGETRVRPHRICFGDDGEGAVDALDGGKQGLAAREIAERPDGACPPVGVGDRRLRIEVALPVQLADDRRARTGRFTHLRGVRDVG